MKLSRAMVIDDSEADQLIAEIALQMYDPNIEIIKAYDGLEALEILKDIDEQPEIIFLDINMPRMNGHEFLKVYDKNKNNKSIIIGMLTSSSQEEDKKKALAYDSVKNYFLKPLDVSDIEDIASNLFS